VAPKRLEFQNFNETARSPPDFEAVPEDLLMERIQVLGDECAG